MTQARKELVDLETTPFYRCTSRCVRQARLFGECHVTGKRFHHRKKWIEDRIALLSNVFSVQVVAYAITDDHYHILLYVDRQSISHWSDEKVIEKWSKLYKIPEEIAKGIKQPKTSVRYRQSKSMINTLRERLSNISWFMRSLNEYVARKANKEDKCTGRFWEGRFKSQPLLDEAAVLSAMAFIDLNLVRKKSIKYFAQSAFTSINYRLKNNENNRYSSAMRMFKLSKKPKHQNCSFVSFSLKNYLDVLAYSEQIIRKKRCAFPSKSIEQLFTRLNLSPRYFTEFLHQPDDIIGLTALGSPRKLKLLTQRLKKSFVRGINSCRNLYVLSNETK